VHRAVIVIGLITFLIILSIVPELSADSNESESQTYLTSDESFHEKIEIRKRTGPQVLKQGLEENLKNSKGLRAFGLSAPTANMLNYDVVHYDIDITLDFSSERIFSEVQMTGKALIDNLAQIDLTFRDNFTINNVQANGQSATYLQSGVLFTVYLPQAIDSGEQFTIFVDYHGYPIFEGTPQSSVGGGLSYYAQYTSQICQTECEPFGSRNWFPCKDFPFDKADSVDLRVTHPTAMTTSANGLLQSITNNGNGTETTYWKTRYPITTYVIHFVTAYQNLYEQQWEYAPGDTMLVVAYAYNGYTEYLNNYLTYTIPGLDILSDVIGLYPFVNEKYGNSFYDQWGMENQTMTVLVPWIAREDIIIHEMAHHWWGNLITCENFHHIWLNEGFGTYTEALYYEEKYGDIIYYHDWIRGQSCFNSGSVYVEDLDNDYIFDGTTTYNKGSRVLHMLRNVVGDSGMFQILSNYQSDPELRYGYARTDDFQLHAEAVYGSSLDWFFNEWIYQPGNPHYQYGWFNWLDTEKSQDKLALTIKQTQNQDPYFYPTFIMPIDIQVFYDGGDTTLSVFNSSANQSFILDIPAPADSIKFDPDQWILCSKSETEFTMASTTNPIDTAYLGQYFYMPFEAIGGTLPYTWEKIGGQFPYGLTFTSGDSSYLEGYPNYVAEFGFKMRVYDSSIPAIADSVWFEIEVVDFTPEYICGDANSDESVNVSDAVWIVNYVFIGGDPPDPMEAGEANCDGNVNISDAVWIINYVFLDGNDPCDSDGDSVPDC
jgi:Peptidase family M1 domain/Peptidase M1 N-terminal domain/Dockerin type I domain